MFEEVLDSKNKMSVNSDPNSPKQNIRVTSNFMSRDSKMRHSYRVSFVGKHGLTTLTGILAILSTIIGGGIVSIPYSFISFGVPLAIIFNILAVVMTVYSAKLYLACKDIVPDKPESLYEIGYMVMGRSSIFMVGGVQFINSFGLMMVYFIIFGDTAGQLFANIFGSGLMNIWYY